MDGTASAAAASPPGRPILTDAEARARFGRRKAAARRTGILSIPGIALLLAVNWWAFGPLMGMVIAGAAGVVFLGILFAVILPRRRAALRASAVNGDLVAFYREDLDREVCALRTGRSLFPIATILGGVAILLGIGSIIFDLLSGRGFLHARPQIAMVVSMAVVLVPQWHRIRVDLPRLEREREELG